MGAVALSALKAAMPGYTGTSDDTQLAVDLAAAEAQVASLCGWPMADDGTQSFETATYTLYPRPSAVRPRMLPLPVVASSITSIHQSTTDTYDATTLTDSDDYTLTNEGVWSLSWSWEKSERGVQVVCEAGWAEGSAPDAVQAAVIAQALHRWRILRTTQGRTTVTQQGSSSVRDSLTAIPELVVQMAMLSPAWRGGSCIG